MAPARHGQPTRRAIGKAALAWALVLSIQVPTEAAPAPSRADPAENARAAVSLDNDNACCDLGYVETKAIRTMRLTVHNPSSNALRIAGIRSECSCMSAEAVPTEIAPKGDTHLAITFHAPPRASHYGKHLVLLLEGGRPLKFPILVTARVGLPLTVEPPTLDLGTLVAGECRRSSVTLRNDGPTPVRPVYATADSPGCYAAVPRAEAPAGGSLPVPVVVQAPPEHAGPVTAHLTIHTDCPEQQDLSVAIRYSLSTRYRLSQGEARLGPLRPGATAVCRFEITAADVGAGDFLQSCELVALENLSGRASLSYRGHRATIACDLVAGPATGPLGGRLVVRLADHPQPVELWISGSVEAVAAPDNDTARESGSNRP
ncbi:MAG TPA: DUF1573 domain-containing protein [Phycisphaerae bacterium]|nr:DUF1573 domain-containing protein [Phycisphaerae bacterium]